MSKFIVVEANIGAGKSTLLPKLVKELGNGWKELQEPVDDPRFAELLQIFYNNPSDPVARIQFQQYITNRRSEMVKHLPTDVNYVLERSLLSDIIFSQCNFLSMEEPDASYMGYYYDIKNKLQHYPKLDACIYLRTSPEVSYGRTISRARDAESGIPLDYLRDLHMFHEACLPQLCREYDIPLLTYNWDDFGDARQIASDVLAPTLS